MPLNVERVGTYNAAGEPVRTFRGNDLIHFQVDFTATDVPPRTNVLASFHIRHMLYHTMPNPAGNLDYVFYPTHLWQFEYVIGGPGWWFIWTNWRLPRDRPVLPIRTRQEWARIFLADHWVFRNWSGPWELTALVHFTEPPRDGQFDHNKDRWLYNIVY